MRLRDMLRVRRRLCAAWSLSVLVFLVLASGLLILPDTVLCLGPHNHCHLELVVGASCNSELAERHRSTTGPADRCPKGSRDFRLNVDSQRTNSSHSLTAPPAMLCIASALLRISHNRSCKMSFRGFQGSQRLEHSGGYSSLLV